MGIEFVYGGFIIYCFDLFGYILWSLFIYDIVGYDYRKDFF